MGPSIPRRAIVLGDDEERIIKVDPRSPPPPPVKAFRVQIAPDLPLGTYEVRLVNQFGISNPMPFVVGDLQVVEEKKNNDDVATAQRVPLNCVLSGTIGSRVDVDYFVFNGNKGQRVLAHARTASIDSRLLAQLNVRCQGQITGFIPSGAHRDSLLDVTLPASGDYFCASVHCPHGGGPNWQLSRFPGRVPYIDAVFPLAVEPGTRSKVTILGRNLPGGVLDPWPRTAHGPRTNGNDRQGPSPQDLRIRPSAMPTFLTPAAFSLPLNFACRTAWAFPIVTRSWSPRRR